MLKIGVLASGRGSNFQSIINAVNSGRLKIGIAVLVTDNASAFCIERAKKHGIPHIIMDPRKYSSREVYFSEISDILKSKSVGLVVLAGFMRIVGKPLIDAFPNRILNIHPALLPSFPGLNGQMQALEYQVKISGCTVHFVDEGMDTGPIIIQAAVPVSQDDTEETLADRILSLEHQIYPEAIRLFSEGKITVEGRRVTIKGYVAPDAYIINPPIQT